MADATSDALVQDKDGVFHRVSGTSYSAEQTDARTFCDVTVPIDDVEEIHHVPIHLLDRTAVCHDCERTYRYIQWRRFPSSNDWTGTHTYVVRSVLRYSETRGQQNIDVIPADSVDEVKQRTATLYQHGLIEFQRISRHEGEHEWVVEETKQRW